MTAVLLAIRTAISLMWLPAGVSKFVNYRATVVSIREYGVLPDRASTSAARLLPTVEVVLGTALLIGLRPDVTGYVVAAVFVCFALAMAWNLAHGRIFDCGCNASGETQISWRLVCRNVFLAALCVAVAIGPQSRLAIMVGTAAQTTGPDARNLLCIPIAVLLAAVGWRLIASVKPVLPKLLRRPPFTATSSPATPVELKVTHAGSNNALR